MIASDTTSAPVDAQEVFKSLAGALQSHLELKNDLDESKVRAIVDEAVADALYLMQSGFVVSIALAIGLGVTPGF